MVHIEIPADDTGKAKTFWGGLFGWQFQDFPGGQGEYRMTRVSETWRCATARPTVVRVGRRPRIEVPGGFYHVHTRGNDRRPIYFGSWSGRLFVRELARASQRHGWRILAYCLMTNHYHVVVRIDEVL